MVNKKTIDKKEDKVSKIAGALADKEIGESVNPTNLARSVGVHPNTYRDMMDEYDVLREIGFRNIRDNKGKLKTTIRTNESLDMRKEMRELRKDMLDMKSSLDEIKIIIKSKK